MEIKNVAIIGMGALGILYGTHMMDAGVPKVTYIMSDERIHRYKGKTFYKNEKPYCLNMTEETEASPADLVIVAVKYNGLQGAAETMKNCVGEHTIIMSVMNGITSEEILASRYGSERLIYTVAQGMDAMKFGEKLTYTKMGELRIGAKEECQKQNLETIHRFFEEIQMPHHVDEDIMHRMWGKFMQNVGINQCCMAYETNYKGCLEKGEANRTLIAAMREVIALANAEGISLGEADLNEYVGILKTLFPEGIPSMRQDAVAKRPSEVEMFAGTVISRAKKYGIYVPANEYLYEKVKEMEAAY